jgi:NAD(P)-dependent dehydrogenase (short-subunit alcohol dehydrogenase family)
MQDRICIVTGASSGIGNVTARVLAAQGATLLIVCRNKFKGEQMLEELRRNSANDDVYLFVADLSSQAEIGRLAGEIKSSVPRIDVLVNNAGGINPTMVLTNDGIETTFAVNHLSFFLLTNLLLSAMKKSRSGRIVNVSSQAHQIGTIRFHDLGFEKNYSPMKAYAQSKLANILFTYECARRLKGRKITVNTLHPGTVGTNFGKNLRGLPGLFFRTCGFLLRSAERGAETVVWLATDPEVESMTGGYFLDKKPPRSSRIYYNTEVARTLWDISARMTSLEQGLNS